MTRPDIGEKLDVKVDEARFAKGWARIESRAFAPRRRLVRPTVGGFAVAAALMLVVVVPRWSSPGPLVAEGSAIDVVLASASSRGGDLELDDGSRIELSAGARVESLENAGTRFSVLLHSGVARFSVTPGGPRRWVVEAGHVTVEVVGTVFTVRRDERGVQVDVERGRVLVRSDRLPEGVRALGAGGSVSIEDELHAAVIEAPPSGRADLVPPPVIDAPPPVRDAVVVDTTSEAVPTASRSRPATPPTTTPPARADEPPPARSSAASLLAEADEARRRGDIERALELLREGASRQDDPDSAIASFTRGRLALSYARPREARDDLERALRLGLPPAIEESARHRLVSASSAAGDVEGARRAADEYLQRYPYGTFRAEVESARP